ncbi:MAG: T9SS type A sorting domain-containing protein, partial [Bacteroidota bacterium]
GPRSDQDVWIIRTDAEGCMQEDCGFEQLITDVEEVTLSSGAQPLIYPNPTRGILHIDTPHSPDAYQLLDSNGRMLQAGAFQPSISLQPWPPGIYLLRLIREQSVATFKVVRQ